MLAPASEIKKNGATAPLALWLIIQLGVLALIVARVPLAAHYPVASETLAPRFVLAAQVIAAALLFPFLLRHIHITAQIVFSAVPFQLAAAYLAGENLRSIVWPALYVEAWLLTLAIWARWIRSQPAQLIAIAIASSLTLGAATLSYLRVEFNPTSSANSLLDKTPPLPATWAILDGSKSIHPWLLLGFLAAAGLIALGFRRRQCARTMKESLDNS